jgi:hypothetical protein
MIIYNYDPVTFEFTTEGEALRNPVNPDQPIIPACATEWKPPKHKDGYTLVWIGNRWDYQEDHRGEVWFNFKKMELETIDFIGTLDSKIYYTPDSPVANKPEGPYWHFDKDLNEWVADVSEYKLYILSIFDTYWNLKLSTPFEFDGHKFLPQWRELYTSIYVSLTSGLKEDYRIQDAEGKTFVVDTQSMTEILRKLAEVVDEMYVDKHNLEAYFKIENNYANLKNAFDTWVDKKYE